jgi:beta-glucanase (GH16 family)
MGNLGRAGYGATTQGLWPYSYDNCDIGTYPNQTRKDGTPGLGVSGEDGFYGKFSFQPGQRLSACTCSGSDHPGPSVSRGRAAPEVDVLEVQVNTETWMGEASQSFQIAPYNAGYRYNIDGSQLMDESKTRRNSYLGGAYQQSLSSLTLTDSNAYSGNGYQTYGVEFYGNRKARDDGYIAWYMDEQPTWMLKASAIGGDDKLGFGKRIIPEEPMSIILNLGIAPSFQQPDFMHLPFPAKMYIDYVRVYQREDMINIGCSPSDYPTHDYIEKHINAYSNPNLTTWAQAGYTFPRNSQFDGC